MPTLCHHLIAGCSSTASCAAAPLLSAVQHNMHNNLSATVYAWCMQALYEHDIEVLLWQRR